MKSHWFHILLAGTVCFWRERGTQFMIKLLVFMKKIFTLNNNFWSVKLLEILFISLKEGKSCKIFLELWLPPDPPTVFGANQNFSPTPRFAQIFPNMQHFPNYCQCRFFYFGERSWYSDESVWILHYTAYLFSLGLLKRKVFGLELYWK